MARKLKISKKSGTRPKSVSLPQKGEKARKCKLQPAIRAPISTYRIRIKYRDFGKNEHECRQTPNTPGAADSHAAVNIFMLIVAVNAALSNRLIASALQNAPFWRAKQAVLVSETGHIAV